MLSSAVYMTPPGWIRREEDKCLDPDLYQRALDLLKSLLGDKLDLPYENYIEYEADTNNCSFPPRATLHVDVSRLLEVEEKVFYPVVRASLYFDKAGKPILHVYKQFKILYAPEEPFMSELLEALREGAKNYMKITTDVGLLWKRRDYIYIETWLEGDEVFAEAKSRVRDMAYTVLYAVKRCPWVVVIREQILSSTYLLLLRLEMSPRELKVLMEEPDLDILKKIDLDRLSPVAKKFAELIEQL